MKRMRRQLFRYHLWLGWLVGIPLLLWTVSGLVMVSRPIETVRGSDLRIDRFKQPIPADTQALETLANGGGRQVTEYRVAMRDGRPIAAVTYADESRALFDAQSGAKLSPIDAAQARRIVTAQISSASAKDAIVGTTLFTAKAVPLDFRKPMPVWQVRLADGTHVYVGRDTGEIEAVRTRFWRFYDVMWGLHIMDMQEREDTHHPILVVFAVLAALATVLAILLMIARYAPRRRRVRQPE